MDNQKQQRIDFALNFLKNIMREENLIFGIMVNKKDINNSKIVFIEKESIGKGKCNACSVTLTELNDGLF